MNRDNADDIGKLLLRLTLGLLILFHGITKITGGIDAIQGMVAGYGLPPMLAYGVFIGEVVAPVLLIAGAFSRIAAALIVVNMLFALVLVHTGQFFSLTENGGWAIELQAFYLLTAASIVLLGSGRRAVRPD